VSAIESVSFSALESHSDGRGSLTEIFREEWSLGIEPVQWNLLRSHPGTLRGVHCHVTHSDAIVVVDGELILGLIDLRPDSSTEGRAELHRVPATSTLVSIPPGVAHGFCFEQATTMVYAVSDYWNLEDELGCRWDDPALGIQWPVTAPVLSPRDRSGGSLEELRASVAANLDSARR
jgi:dTDP-4-dehydrorhamnose 3,5-epimerase